MPVRKPLYVPRDSKYSNIIRSLTSISFSSAISFSRTKYQNSPLILSGASFYTVSIVIVFHVSRSQTTTCNLTTGRLVPDWNTTKFKRIIARYFHEDVDGGYGYGNSAMPRRRWLPRSMGS